MVVQSVFQASFLDGARVTDLFRLEDLFVLMFGAWLDKEFGGVRVTAGGIGMPAGVGVVQLEHFCEYHL